MATILHDSDCATHNEPALPKGPCDCGAAALEHAADWRAALEEIRDGHLGDQPAAYNVSDLEWAKRHIDHLRTIARTALKIESHNHTI